ncbi:MAG: phytanoyl-CoA dioxygenase [Planctomycetota bacterium]|nr:MAG: phytanoyl-CoA dioxygenase [Planctomycetota bacterium]
MIDKNLLLTSKQMAEFVSNGFLKFDGLISRDLCERAEIEMASGSLSKFNNSNGTIDAQGSPFSEVWTDPDLAIGQIFRLPEVQGIIESLIGPNPRYDHHFPHLIQGKSTRRGNLHQDAELDPRFESFDIQISFFPSDVPPDMGGTLFVPGSHFRRVHESSINRYQNIVGQQQCVCKAGTILFWHHNLWHSGRSNHTDRDRYMFKLRLNPTVKQMLLWNTDDLEDPEINSILNKKLAWHGQQGRIEEMNRIRLWRSLTDQPEYDLKGYYWSRITNVPN